MRWGNAIITKRFALGDQISIFAKINEDDKDYKKTKKISWLCADPNTTIQIKLVEYAHLINKQKVEDSDHLEELVNINSKIENLAIAEGNLRTLQKGTIFQFERRGFYIVDKIGLAFQPMTCIFIPDGKAKSMSTISHSIDAAET